jgi:hypothetical protein
VAPPPLLPGVMRVALQWSRGGQSAVNVLHFAASDETTLAGQLNANVTDLLITQLDNTSATQNFAATGAGWLGSGAGTDYDPAVAGLISTQTGFRGLGSNGRIYLPFTDSTQTTEGVLAGAIETSMQTAWTTFVTSMGAAGSPLQVTSYGVYTKGDPGPPQEWIQVSAPVSRSVTTVNVRSALATQRRRQGRVRANVITLLALRALERAQGKPAEKR